MSHKDTPSSLKTKKLSFLSQQLKNTPSLSDLDVVAKSIAQWDNKACVSEDLILEACCMPYAPLLKELVIRAHEKVCHLSCLNKILDGENYDIPSQQKEDACRVFLPKVSGKDYVKLMEYICNSGFAPLCQEVFDQAKPFLTQEKIAELVTTVIFGERLNPSPKNDTTVAQNRAYIVSAILNDTGHTLENEGIFRVVCRFSGLEYYLKALIPHFPKQASINLLSYLLLDHPSMGTDTFDQQKQPSVVRYLYEQNKDFWLSYTDPQLEVFVPKRGNPIFWDIHNAYRLQKNLKEGVMESLENKPSGFLKKM